MARFVYECSADYPGVGEIKPKDIYELIKKHSRLIDRLNPARMAEMMFVGQDILFRVFDKIDPDDMTWTFYGKRSLRNRNEW